MDNIVVVFTMDGCPFCEMMKSQLIESQIDFVERNIREILQTFLANIQVFRAWLKQINMTRIKVIGYFFRKFR